MFWGFISLAKARILPQERYFLDHRAAGIFTASVIQTSRGQLCSSYKLFMCLEFGCYRTSSSLRGFPYYTLRAGSDSQTRSDLLPSANGGFWRKHGDTWMQKKPLSIQPSWNVPLYRKETCHS